MMKSLNTPTAIYNYQIDKIILQLGDLKIELEDLLENDPGTEHEHAELKRHKRAIYEAYGRFGFDQLLGQGNPYDHSLETLKIETEES